MTGELVQSVALLALVVTVLVQQRILRAQQRTLESHQATLDALLQTRG